VSLCVAGVSVLSAAPQQAKEEKFEAYAEWRKGDLLIVDGQRVRWQPNAKFKGSGPARSFASVPLGYEANVKGRRDAAGVLLATELEAKPNGNALFEKDAKAATSQMEAQWLKAGQVVEPGPDGKPVNMGKLLTSGPDVDRVRRIVARLVPPYLKPTDFRVYVLENKEWNAFACANGMIVVHNGLLQATSDDEIAIVLGHELVHTTHEHSRKQIKSSMGLQGLALGVALGVSAGGGDPSTAAKAAGLASNLALSAIQNGYGRDAEDQADRAGLRYAFEGGFDVTKGPALWNRFAEKYGSQDQVTNFFFGSHSRAVDRARNLTREISLNYK
jgi:Zn-dependent protease with chaperone function